MNCGLQYLKKVQIFLDPGHLLRARNYNRIGSIGLRSNYKPSSLMINYEEVVAGLEERWAVFNFWALLGINLKNFYTITFVFFLCWVLMIFSLFSSSSASILCSIKKKLDSCIDFLLHFFVCKVRKDVKHDDASLNARQWFLKGPPVTTFLFSSKKSNLFLLHNVMGLCPDYILYTHQLRKSKGLWQMILV